MKDIETIITGLTAYGFDCAAHDGGVKIYDDNMGAYYAVSVEDAADLLSRLRSGEDDAYSLWCSETDAEEVL